MSKSLGNFYTVHELLAEFPGEALRLASVQTHYRQPLDFTKGSLTQAKRTLDRFYGALMGTGAAPETAEMARRNRCRGCRRPLPDFDTPAALAVLHQRLSALNRASTSAEKTRARRRLLAAGEPLGLLTQDPDARLRRPAGRIQGSPRWRSPRASKPVLLRARPKILPRPTVCAPDCWPRHHPGRHPRRHHLAPRLILPVFSQQSRFHPVCGLDSTMRRTCGNVTRFCFDRGDRGSKWMLRRWLRLRQVCLQERGRNDQIIVPQLLKGAVVPFLGAGASMFHRRLLNTPTLCPPSASELAEHFANTAQLPRNSEEYEQIPC